MASTSKHNDLKYPAVPFVLLVWVDPSRGSRINNISAGTLWFMCMCMCVHNAVNSYINTTITERMHIALGGGGGYIEKLPFTRRGYKQNASTGLWHSTNSWDLIDSVLNEQIPCRNIQRTRQSNHRPT